MGTNPNHRPPIHLRDHFPHLYIHKAEHAESKTSSTISFITPLSMQETGSERQKVEHEELIRQKFEKLYKFISATDEFHESSSIPFATSPALLGSHRK
jgi:hypothetical protein